MPNTLHVAKFALILAVALGATQVVSAKSPWAMPAAAPNIQLAEGADSFFRSLDKAASDVLPQASKPPEPQASADRADYDVVVFTDDAAQGAALVTVLKLRGYTQARLDDSEPNKPSNIKWGMAQPPMIDDILGVMQSMFDVDPASLERRKAWANDDNDIFININFAGGAAVAAAPKPVPELARAEFEVVVFADDQAKAAKLVTALKARGYR